MSITGGDDSIIHLTEWDETTVGWEPTLNDHQALAQINEDTTRLKLTPGPVGVTLRSRQYVGNVGFPSGRTVVIEPKAAGDNFPYLLQFADRTGTSLPYPTRITTGEKFFEPVVEAYLDRLENLLASPHRRLHPDKHVRKGYSGSKLDPSGAARFAAGDPTARPFKTEREDFNTDANKLLIAALDAIDQGYDVRDELENRVRKARGRLSSYGIQWVGSDRQRQQLADNVDRLISTTSTAGEEYDEALRMAANIASGRFIDTIDVGNTVANSYLIDMNVVFEEVVEKIFEAAAEEVGPFRVDTNDRSTALTPNPAYITVQPDVVVKQRDGTPVFVADAKWKTQVAAADRNQVVTYSVAYDCPVALVYPDQDGDCSETYDLRTGHSLHAMELPTGTAASTKEEFREKMVKPLSDVLLPVLED
jgi:hypothetical protein